ncbi:TetR family transcriptional regulator [Gordonia sp. X0973]|uniref:TetR family transcriptional regulator n=1 Tax=Gordonia sp. X0973 TaxID=2742602 RepID=UPI000F5333F9|nr:TetR family transcriptional regulator [Gordonia sp. X0973]QKT06611.1 TetR family transcriptional regulator [Gordonia sp. X0973]
MATPVDGGVRAQKKARTRAAIRSAAMTLFTEQGYSATTVEQIAHTAGVSHTTFFRYFTSKEQVIISDDLQEARDEALAAIPPGLDHFELLRQMIAGLFEVGLADEWAASHERLALINSDPELRFAYQLETERAISEATEFISDYTGVPTTDLHLQVFVAAVSGVMFYLANSQEEPDHDEARARLLAAIDLLERGLPLRD